MLDTFLYISLLLFCTTMSSNFQYVPIVTRFIQEMSHVFQCVPPTTYIASGKCFPSGEQFLTVCVTLPEKTHIVFPV